MFDTGSNCSRAPLALSLSKGLDSTGSPRAATPPNLHAGHISRLRRVPAFPRHRAILLPLLSAALLGALLLHGSAPAVEAQTLEKPEAAQLVRLHLGAYLFWHESSGADGYEIQIRSQSGGTWGSWSSISYTGTTQPATVTGLAAGTRYQWRIRATSGSEQSEWSTHDDVNDLAYNWTVESLGRSIANPAVLQSAEPGDPGEVTVTWTHGPARSGVTITGWTVGYRLFSEPVDQIRQTSLLAASATMATVTGLTGGEQYEFWVRPYVGGYPGRTSNALEATPTTTSTYPLQCPRSPRTRRCGRCRSRREASRRPSPPPPTPTP